VDGKLRRKPVAARAEVLTATADLERVQRLLLGRYKFSYRVVMLFYRLGRRLRGKQTVADGAALAITLEWDGTMTKEDFTHQVRRTAFLTVALVAALVFGVIVLAEGDWIPGGVIVASALIALAGQIPVIRKLCSDGPASAPPGSNRPARRETR
jgi:hypothetical protein